ncbi:hypothetical protein RD792_003589 [Penstemon davidsonii]|uniref:Uncharacterized protein n=1 Tax=Penstemon davidsonii TaxID=160366 RepID=A0ABR0DGJ8_9LAMI|nr:hypothetical protein RD792_003589 [Penstemon davidsonii]
MDNQGTTSILQNRIVLFPLPFQGHINPMFQLANILHSRGFNISIIHTEYNFPNPSKYPHFNFHIISDGLLESGISDPVHIIKFLNSNCVEPFRECLDRLMFDYHVDCVITDANWPFTQAIADSVNLPRIVLRTSSICSFLAFAAVSLFRDKGYLSNLDLNMDAPIEEFPPLKIKDIPQVEASNLEDVFQIIDSMVQQTKKASALIFNTFSELEEPDLPKLYNQFLMPTFTIGPFHKFFSASTTSLLTQDMNSISWLDKQEPKSVLYVSFGSIASMDAQKLQEVSFGLANSKQPFLWVIRPGLVHGSEWIETLPNEILESISERGYVVKWAPQQEVLSHFAIGGFWTHSGWNSTLESICEGVPMICSSFFGDQMTNSRYVSDVWKIGIKLEKGLERGEIENAIRRLMVEREGDEMRERIMCLKEKIDVCLNPGGSPYQSLEKLVDFITSLRSFTV